MQNPSKPVQMGMQVCLGLCMDLHSLPFKAVQSANLCCPLAVRLAVQVSTRPDTVLDARLGGVSLGYVVALCNVLVR